MPCPDAKPKGRHHVAGSVFAIFKSLPNKNLRANLTLRGGFYDAANRPKLAINAQKTARLPRPEACINATLRDKLIMRALFGNTPLIHNNQTIKRCDC